MSPAMNSTGDDHRFCHGAVVFYASFSHCVHSSVFNANLKKAEMAPLYTYVPLTAKQHRWPEHRRSQIGRIVRSRLAITPVLSDTRATRVFKKNIHYKLSTRPNALKFRQHLCEGCKQGNEFNDSQNKVCG